MAVCSAVNNQLNLLLASIFIPQVTWNKILKLSNKWIKKSTGKT